MKEGRPAASASRSSRSILLLSTAGFFGISSTTVSKSPVLPLFVKSLSASETVVGLIAAISPLAGVFFSFPVGILADRWGKRRLLLVSAGVLLAAPLLYLLVRNPFWLVPIRFFHGIATAILTPVASAFVLGAYPESKGEKLGLFSSATLVGRTLAPLLGGALISAFLFLGGSLPYRAVYLGAFLLSVPVLFLVLALPRDTTGDDGRAGRGPPPVTVAGEFLPGLRDFLRNRRVLGTSIVEMGTYFAYGTLETYLPLYLASLGVPAYEIGLVFSLQVLSIALTKPLFGRLADRVDRRRQVLGGIALLGVAIAVVPWLARRRRHSRDDHRRPGYRKTSAVESSPQSLPAFAAAASAAKKTTSPISIVAPSTSPVHPPIFFHEIRQNTATAPSAASPGIG